MKLNHLLIVRRPLVAGSCLLAILLAAIGRALAADPEDDGKSLRLVVVVVVDQLRGDCLDRFGRALGDDGLWRLAREGVWYRNGHYSHAHTVTGPGHATIGTGGRPAGHGIVSNEWVDRKSGSRVNCVADGQSPTVGTANEGGNASPLNLTATTFADEWVLATNGRARSFGISGKDRAAILPVGKTGKAFWFNTGSGRMVTSKYYYREMPPWAAEFSKKEPAKQFFKKSWERQTRDDDGVAVGEDNRSFEKDIHGMGRTFPHPFGKDMKEPEGKFYEQIFASIYNDQIVMDFALECLEAENLGRRGSLDVLSISLSANDSVGHNFGPDSVEAKEVFFGVDRQVARLLKALDTQVGRGRYLLAFTADHGVGFSPEVLNARHYDAARFESGDILKKIDRKLNYTIRYLDWSAGFAASGYYFDPDALRFGGKSPEELETIVADVIRESPGIAQVFTRSEILSGRLPDTDIARKVRAMYNAARSPDIFMVGNAYWLEGSGTASHGTPYSYDTHVPIIFYGAGVPPEEVTRPVDVMDIAATLTAILRCTRPSACEGKPLEEVSGRLKARPLPLSKRGSL